MEKSINNQPTNNKRMTIIVDKISNDSCLPYLFTKIFNSMYDKIDSYVFGEIGINSFVAQYIIGLRIKSEN